MTQRWDAVYGWQEEAFSAAITNGTAVKAIDGRAGYKLMIRRVRGTADQSLTFHDGDTSTIVLQTNQANFDIPGLEIKLSKGNDLYIDTVSGNTTEAATDVYIQYAWQKVFD